MRTKHLLTLMILCLMSSMAWGEECQIGPRPPGTDLRSLTGLQSLSGSKFELQYMKLMYQLHSDTQALAETELKSTMDVGLRQLSNNIKGEQYDLNKKLDLWYRKMTGTQLSDYCINSNAEFQQLQQTNWRNFDTVYADIMLDYLRRAKDASTLLLSKGSNADLRNQAGIVIKTSDREIAALQRWQNNQPMFD